MEVANPEVVANIVMHEGTMISFVGEVDTNTHRLLDVARAVEGAGGDAIVAVNTVKAMAISVEARRPVLQPHRRFVRTRHQGRWPRCVYELYEAVDIPIIGVGGGDV